MPTPASKSPAKSTTRGYSYKKSEEEADIQRMRFTEKVRDGQSRDGGDGSDSMSIDSPLPPKEPSCMNHGNGDAAQSGNAAGGVDSDLPLPKVSTGATKTPSITMFQGSSHFQFNNSTLTAATGDVTVNNHFDGTGPHPPVNHWSVSHGVREEFDEDA